MHELVFDREGDLERHQALAEAEGYGERRFNAWLLLKLANALSGQVHPAGYVEGLRSQVQRLTLDLERARDDHQEEREARKKAVRDRDRALALLHRLEGGAELAGGFLGDVTGGRA